MKLNYILYILIGAFFWAKMEIEIEGPHGWASNLPTWKIDKHILLDLFYGGRPLTGYHLWAFSVVFFIFHMPIVWVESWSIRKELNVIGGYYLFWVMEDVLWFILNPNFGWRKFGFKNIWWHKHWFLGLPFDYWILGTIGLTFIFIP